MEQISKLLRDFLWQGGKGNQDKIHLISWDIVKRDITEGGLQIRDPALVNMALGGKILWKLHNEPKHLVSQALMHKYADGTALRNLQACSSVKFSQTWNLFRKVSNSLDRRCIEYLVMARKPLYGMTVSWIVLPYRILRKSQTLRIGFSVQS